jgi:hypothetical protein
MRYFGTKSGSATAAHRVAQDNGGLLLVFFNILDRPRSVDFVDNDALLGAQLLAPTRTRQQQVERFGRSDHQAGTTF